MRLEFLDASDGGKYPNACPKSLIRLSEFTEEDKQALIQLIDKSILKEGKQLRLHEVDFIKAVNCQVTLHLAEAGNGLVEIGPNNEYDFLLSREGFIKIMDILYHLKDGHNWLTPGEYLDEPSFLITKFRSW